MPSVAVVGASHDRSKFGNKAVRSYLRRGWTVHPVNPHATEIEGLSAVPDLASLPGPVQRVLLYVPPAVGVTLLDDVAALGPGVELWVNPGAGDEPLRRRARDLGLDVVEACAIVAIGESPSSYGP